MKKIILLSSIVATLSFGAEVQWGHGTVKVKGGFIGLDYTISDDIDTYTLIENHKNLMNTNWFYGYDFTIFDSKKIRQAQRTINTGISNLNTFLDITGTSLTIPELEYRLQGADLGISIGYDLIHESDRDYLGVGAYGGISLPYIKSSKSLSSTVKVNLALADYFKDSKTEFTTFKIGIGAYGQKSLNDMLSVYANAIYAFQTGSVENDYINSDFDVDGTYLELNAGLKFRPVKGKVGFLSPNLYGTIGWRYREWNVDDVALNISGIASLHTPKSDMKFSTNVVTVGLGYSF